MFHILRIASGSIMGEMKNSSQTHFFDYSYMTNFLEDFMKALLYVHGDWAQDEYVNQFKTVWEPSTEKWNMTFSKDKLFVNIKEYEDMDTREYRGEKTLEFNYYEFLEAFIIEMKEMLDKYGLLGYRDSWGEEFPISLYLKLVDISRKTNKIELKTISQKNNMGFEASKTDIGMEVTVINEILG